MHALLANPLKIVKKITKNISTRRHVRSGEASVERIKLTFSMKAKHPNPRSHDYFIVATLNACPPSGPLWATVEVRAAAMATAEDHAPWTIMVVLMIP